MRPTPLEIIKNMREKNFREEIILEEVEKELTRLDIAGRTVGIDRITELENFLKAHEQWEADFISENSMWWPNREKDALNSKLYEDFLKLQEQRNQLLKK